MKNNKFPTWYEAILGITDSRLKDEVYSNFVRYYIGVGAKIMYDRLYSMLSQDAVLTTDAADKEQRCSTIGCNNLVDTTPRKHCNACLGRRSA